MADNNYISAFTSSQCSTCGVSSKADGSKLSLCGKCHNRAYCSVACQKKDWSTHKISCTQSEKKTFTYDSKQASIFTFCDDPDVLIGAGVLLEPTDQINKFNTSIASSAMIASRSRDYPVFDLALPAKLGFPLRLIGQATVNAIVPNIYTAMLSVDPDPHSATFGSFSLTTTPLGPTIVARPNGEPLHTTHINVLLHFCSMLGPELENIDKAEPKARMGKKRDLAANVMTVENFRSFWESVRKVEIMRNPIAWKGVTCPV